MVVLIAETVSVAHTTIDVKDSLNHANACFSAEVLSVYVIDFPFFHNLRW